MIVGPGGWRSVGQRFQLGPANLHCFLGSKDMGEVYLLKDVLGGTFLLRACSVNFCTNQADMGAIPEIIVQYGRELRG